MGTISLELNELNFEYIQSYVEKGYLPNFRDVLTRHDLVRTDAGADHPHLEPWIQWPTVYSGLDQSVHGVFRLGDAPARLNGQIWEVLEDDGLTVGAVLPMNGAAKCRAPAFFLPDPWTGGTAVADEPAIRLYTLLAEMVRDNAVAGRSAASYAMELLPMASRFMQLTSLPDYARMAMAATRYKWAKAIVLDRILGDIFLSLWHARRPGYSSLFLNGAAHVQHHHTYDASAYDGPHSNPAWYSGGSTDPLLFAYRFYDGLLGQFLRLPGSRVIVTTGLGQVANRVPHYQYRLKDYEAFFRAAGLRGFTVTPRMSRDFLLEFANDADRLHAVARLAQFECAEAPLFLVDDRGDSLFCQVGYFGPPENLPKVTCEGQPGRWGEDIVLVSIENAIHCRTGYYIDTGKPAVGDSEIPLTEVFGRLRAAALERARAA